MDRRTLLSKIVPAVLVSPGLVLVKPGVWQWRTAKGEFIPINKIEDSHLLNIERMLRGDGRQEYDLPGKEDAHIRILQEVAARRLRTKPAIFATRGKDRRADRGED